MYTKNEPLAPPPRMYHVLNKGGDWQTTGFRGGSFGVARGSSQEMDEGDLAATYSALAALVALEVDLAAEVDGNALVRALGSLQQEDGRWVWKRFDTIGLVGGNTPETTKSRLFLLSKPALSEFALGI